MKTDRVNRPKWSTFDTSVEQAANENSPENCKGSSRQVVNAFQKSCIFCEKQQTLAECPKIRNQSYKGRIEFLKGKRLCFSCLTQGHLSKDCKKRASYEHCSKKHA